MTLAPIIAAILKASPSQVADLRAFDGVWVYVEDLTPGRELSRLGPPMSSTFSLQADGTAMVLVSGHGSGNRNVKVTPNGPHTDVSKPDGSFVRYRATWKDGVFAYETESAKAPGDTPTGKIRKEFQPTAEGLKVTVHVSAFSSTSVALYKHPEDIPMPIAAKATIGDLAWLAGNWSGTRGTTNVITTEERWSSALGGSMLAVSRTVSRGKMSAFEYLRIVERDGGLVYIAQPNGTAPTEFVLTELSPNRAVFENPRHDYPKRIAYELAPDGSLSATIGYLKGGSPRRFEFKRQRD